jgi:hypothetical protein
MRRTLLFKLLICYHASHLLPCKLLAGLIQQTNKLYWKEKGAWHSDPQIEDRIEECDEATKCSLPGNNQTMPSSHHCKVDLPAVRLGLFSLVNA